MKTVCWGCSSVKHVLGVLEQKTLWASEEFLLFKVMQVFQFSNYKKTVY